MLQLSKKKRRKNSGFKRWRHLLLAQKSYKRVSFDAISDARSRSGSRACTKVNAMYLLSPRKLYFLVKNHLETEVWAFAVTSCIYTCFWTSKIPLGSSSVDGHPVVPSSKQRRDLTNHHVFTETQCQFGWSEPYTYSQVWFPQFCWKWQKCLGFLHIYIDTYMHIYNQLILQFPILWHLHWSHLQDEKWASERKCLFTEQ